MVEKNESLPIRMFVYPHYSIRDTENHPENIFGDSNFHTLRGVLNALLQKNPDKYHFYYSIPKGTLEIFSKTFIKYLNNFTFLEKDIGGTGSGTKLFVDLKNLSKSWKSGFIPDIFWNNVPEVTLMLQQWLFSKGHRPITMTYSHWLPGEISRTYRNVEFDYKYGGYVPELNYFINYTSSAYNACNSKWSRNRILDSLNFIENFELRSHIEQTLQPLYLGVTVDELEENETNKRFDKFTLLFNHRWNQYTGYTHFRKAILRFIKKYPNEDFQIVFTSPNKTFGVVSDDYNLPKKYIYDCRRFKWKEYCELLWKSDVEIGMHTGDGPWSIPMIEGVCCNSIPLYREGIFFDEMFEKIPDEIKNPIFHFKFDDKNYDDFCTNLKCIIDNQDEYRKTSKEYGKYTREEWRWENKSIEWENVFDKLKNRILPIKKSPEIYKFMMQFMRNRQKTNWNEIKKCLKMGDQRSLLRYKNKIERLNETWLRDNMKSDIVEFEKIAEPPKELLREEREVKGDIDIKQRGLDDFK